MGVSGQRHAPASLLPPGKGPPVPIVQEAGWAPEPMILIVSANSGTVTNDFVGFPQTLHRNSRIVSQESFQILTYSPVMIIY
jgi:hypothetical protein